MGVHIVVVYGRNKSEPGRQTVDRDRTEGEEKEKEKDQQLVSERAYNRVTSQVMHVSYSCL